MEAKLKLAGLLFAMILCGCGQSAPSPAAADPAQPQGTAADQAVTDDDPTTPAARPASLAEVRQAIDWFTFPKPKENQWEETDLLKTDYWVLGTLDDATAFYRKAMASHGWSEIKSGYRAHGKDLTLAFAKGGFLVSLRLEGKAQSVKVHMQNRGNVDARLLPRPADAKTSGADRLVVAFETPSKPDAVAEFCRQEFAKQGWRETPGHAVKSKESMSVRFVQNAMECSATIHMTETGATRIVIYHARVRDTFEPAEVQAVFAAHDIPKPAAVHDALQTLDLRKLPRMGDGDFLTNTGLVVRYEALATVAPAVAFYRKTLTEQGWTLTPPFLDVFERGALHFEKAGYHLSVDIENLIDENKAGFSRITLTNHGNVDPRQLPYPPGAEISSHHPFRRSTTTASAEEAAAFYRKELAQRGWREVKNVFLAFVQNDVKLVIIIHKPRNGQTPIELHTEFPARP